MQRSRSAIVGLTILNSLLFVLVSHTHMQQHGSGFGFGFGAGTRTGHYLGGSRMGARTAVHAGASAPHVGGVGGGRNKARAFALHPLFFVENDDLLLPFCSFLPFHFLRDIERLGR